MSSSVVNEHHCGHEANTIDPDRGNTWSCSACNLPIFATPFTGGGGGGTLLHDQCGDLPEVLKECEVHPQMPLFLRDNDDEISSCSECSAKCGSKLYSCADPKCNVVLDVACALPLKILHRSHPHRLLSIRTSSSFGTCGVCGITHQTAPVGRSYICRLCGYWIHPECAMTPNTIEHDKHDHPLVLYYDVGATFGAQNSTPLDSEYFFHPPTSQQNNDKCRICAICNKDVGTRVGIYACIKCPEAILHIYCAKSDPAAFKPVLGEEARFPNLVRLPLPDEHESLVSYAAIMSGVEMIRSKFQGVDYSAEYLHGVLCGSQHSFILHNNDLSDHEDGRGRVCDACLKMIKTPPYYSCSICPKFFFHHYCSRLPFVLSANPTHLRGHNLLIYPGNTQAMKFRKLICTHCHCLAFNVNYGCGECGLYRFCLDVACALMPSVVTHEAHSTGHFLLLSEHCRGLCHCCGRSLEKKLGYECRTCSKFSLHTWCAMLPKTVTHKFDPHPLHLMNSPINGDICEICEKRVEEGVWCYRCQRCDQSFHFDCIPCLDMLYKIKSLITSATHDQREYTNIPTRLIRGLTLQGHGHDYCTDVADEYDDILQTL